MKHITLNRINDIYDVVVATGYCNLQHLLVHNNATYYNAGVYGWNCDIYTFLHKGKRIAIVTGYRNLRGVRLDYDVVKEYDDKAQNIISWEYKASYEQKRQEINELLNSFLDYCIEA